MTWQLAIIAHGLIETAFALLYRKYTQKHPGQRFLTLALMYGVAVFPIGVAWSLCLGGPRFDFPPYLWLFLILGGTMFALGNGALYAATSRLEAARVAVIYSCRIIFAVAGAGLLLGQTLHAGQLPGAVIIFLAALLVAFAGWSKIKKDVPGRYIGFAFVAAAILGLALVNEKFLLQSTSLATYLVVGWGLQMICMAVLAGKNLRQVSTVFKDGRIKMILGLGVLRASAGLCFTFALTNSGNAALIASIAAWGAVLVAVASYIFLGERQHGVLKFAAAVAAGVGVILLVNG